MLEILEKQKEFFNSHATVDVNFRLAQLKKLKSQINVYYDQICSAFLKDLNKHEYDVVSTELGLVMKELNFMLRNLKRLAKPKRVCTSIINMPSKGYKVYQPYGTVLVAAPWNYPFQLTLIPTIGAMAAGNTVVIKPSRNTPNVTKVIKKIFDVFDDSYAYVVTKENEIENLLDERFDFIFYTGSPNKARELMEKQSKYLTPMVLELGGKSPCIVDSDADILASAKRVIWGKFLNAGQTCVAPDYVLLHSSIKDQWLECAKNYIEQFYYEDGKLKKDFVKIVNQKNMERLKGLIDTSKIFFGGKVEGEKLEPTILENVKYEDKVMQEEIFGPIMPVIEFDDLDKELDKIDRGEKTLALYYFGQSKEKINRIKNNCRYGGGCINDTIMHLCEEGLPFGGLGNSGMGSYHGKQTFYTFSHEKSVLQKSPTGELNIKYPPINNKKLSLTKFIFRIKTK
ncbi:MAG: aldehyde dehydrogenase family protein [Clostridia bacterium]|nr:aldehyde dehydrogenase family protein [Clostridia bacterium]